MTKYVLSLRNDQQCIIIFGLVLNVGCKLRKVKWKAKRVKERKTKKENKQKVGFNPPPGGVLYTPASF